MNNFNFQTACRAESAYPEISVSEPNHTYARYILDNIGGHNSEMTAISYYYGSALRMDSELSGLIMRINQVEMHHLMIFGKLVTALGETALLWTNCGRRKVWWSPSFTDYPGKLSLILETALSHELATIEKYKWQMEKIQDQNIQDNLSRIIEDEKIHVEIFQNLLSYYKAH